MPTVLQAESGDLYFTDRYARYLSDDWPKEVLDSYRKGVMELAQKPDRAIYQQVAQYLKKMMRITGGNKVAGSLVREFREKHKNRPTFMKILAKVKIDK